MRIALVVEGKPDSVPLHRPIIADQVPADDIICVPACRKFIVITYIRIGRVVVDVVVVEELALENQVVEDFLLAAEVQAPILVFGDAVKDL